MTPGSSPDWKIFVAGYVGLFVGLTLLVELGAPAELASALALSIAGGATALYLPDVMANVTRATQGKG